MINTRIPIIIVTGFLGSGKTTFINSLLSSLKDKKIAIIENEFAELSIDADLINKKKASDIFELNNGCICCTMNGELEGVFKEIVEKNLHYDGIVIEATGVADPSPIVNSIVSNQLMNEYFRLDSIYTIVDCKHIDEQLSREFETKKQIAFANTVILNKIDTIEKSSSKLELIKDKIITINPDSEIISTNYSKISFHNIFHKQNFELKSLNSFSKSLNSFSFENISLSPTLQENHSNSIQSFGIRFKDELSVMKFDFFIKMLIQTKEKDLYRYKGIINVKDSNQAIIFQGVHDSVDWFPGPPWKNDLERETKIVFIGKNLDKKEIEDGIKILIGIHE